MGYPMLLRFISHQKRAGGHSPLIRYIFRSLYNCCGELGAPHRMMSTHSSPRSSTLAARTAPWLTVQPSFEGGDMVYNFYSLSEEKVVSCKKRDRVKQDSSLELPDDDARLVGSSHGWLALLNRRDMDLFLANPISGRHIKLPPLHTLPEHEINLSDGHRSVSRVIISSSPDDKAERCTVVICFGPGDRLALCFPGDSSPQWLPIIKEPYYSNECHYVCWARVKDDFAFCRTDFGVELTCLSKFRVVLNDWKKGMNEYEDRIFYEDWELGDEYFSFDPNFELYHHMKHYYGSKECCWWWEENKALLEGCMQIPHWVCAGVNNDFIVIRFVKGRKMVYDGNWGGFRPYKTIGFSVLRVVREDGGLHFMLGSLDGLAMFVGMNHSFAITAAEYAGVKPNSIYFTEAHLISSNVGGHDIGIFDFENKTLSSCYCDCDLDQLERDCDHNLVKRVVPPHMWFTPCPSL